jgi:hypothetical protein
MKRKKTLQSSIDFLVKSIDPVTKGSRAFYSPILYAHKGGWSKAYPETTGYIIKTFDDLIFEKDYNHLNDVNERMANWLLSIQMEDGAFSGGLYNPKKDLQKSIFNTAQIIIGLYSRYSNTNNIIYLESGIKASNWLASCINENGFFDKYHYKDGFMPSYYSRVCWPLLLFKDFDGYRKENLDKVIKVLKNIKQKKLSNYFISDSGFNPNSFAFLHTIAYTIRGFIESSFILNDDEMFNTAYNLAEKFLHKYERKKRLAGAYYENFNEVSSYRCLTGEAQMVIIWNIISQKTNDYRFLNAGLKLLDSLEKEVPKNNILLRKGGLCGSKPYWGKYIAFRQPNWATKFLIDAIIAEEQTKLLLK